MAKNVIVIFKKVAGLLLVCFILYNVLRCELSVNGEIIRIVNRMYCRATFGSFQTFTETDDNRCLAENPDLETCRNPNLLPSMEIKKTVKTGRMSLKAFNKFNLGDAVHWSVQEATTVAAGGSTAADENHLNRLNNMQNRLNALFNKN